MTTVGLLFGSFDCALRRGYCTTTVRLRVDVLPFAVTLTGTV